MTAGVPTRDLQWPDPVERSIDTLAPYVRPVLLTGLPGTGKSTVARELHRRSRRRGPFDAMNCAAVPDTLFAAELFGARKGAFTDAVPRPGKIASARGGTLLLDEIGDLSAYAQGALTVFLDTGEYQPLGSDRTEHADVRLVFATWRPLDALRPDLLDRLAAFRIHLEPPDPQWLRERLGDWVCELAAHHGTERKRIDPAVTERLIREVERTSSLRTARTCIERGYMEAHHAGAHTIRLEHLHGLLGADPPAELDAAAVLRHLEQADGNVTAAARAAGVARSTFYRRMTAVGIRPPRR